jgi:hypothetical protein
MQARRRGAPRINLATICEDEMMTILLLAFVTRMRRPDRWKSGREG